MLVTGANGFVGPWLVKALAAHGAKVSALVHSAIPSNTDANIQFVRGDITDFAAISKLIHESNIDTVYHLAANNINTGAGISPYHVFETNTRGVYSILEACRTAPHKVRAVVASSKEVDACFTPASKRKHHPYMTSKAAAELITRSYMDTFGLAAVIMRSDNIYGGGDLNWQRLVPGTIRSLLQGETPTIRSNGLFKRDYVYVEDAVAAYLAVGSRLDNPEVSGRLFRIATGTATTVYDMVKQCACAAGKPDLEPRVLNEKSEERIDTLYSPEMEQTILGWKSQFSLEQGLARTVQWYRENLERK